MKRFIKNCEKSNVLDLSVDLLRLENWIPVRAVALMCGSSMHIYIMYKLYIQKSSSYLFLNILSMWGKKKNVSQKLCLRAAFLSLVRKKKKGSTEEPNSPKWRIYLYIMHMRLWFPYVQEPVFPLGHIRQFFFNVFQSVCLLTEEESNYFYNSHVCCCSSLSQW